MDTNVESTITPVPADKLPADVIRQQLGYAPRVVPKRKDQKQTPQRTADVRVGSNGRYINAFDTFWANVRSIEVKNPQTAPVGSIHRGAKGSDAAHLLATLGKDR